MSIRVFRGAVTGITYIESGMARWAMRSEEMATDVYALMVREEREREEWDNEHSNMAS